MPRVAPLVVLLVAACSGATDPVAQFDSVVYKSSVYAINGTPIGVPTAINTVVAATVRAEVAYDFDVAFDMDEQGRPVVITQRVVGRPLGLTGHAVSLQIIDVPFDDLDEAPRTGWIADSLLTVEVGQVLAIRSQPTACQFDIGTSLYSKMQIDSVDVPTRRLWVTTLTDPNCGFRGLTTGRPRF
jgi:hypothetical protein